MPRALALLALAGAAGASDQWCAVLRVADPVLEAVGRSACPWSFHGPTLDFGFHWCAPPPSAPPRDTYHGFDEPYPCHRIVDPPELRLGAGPRRVDEPALDAVAAAEAGERDGVARVGARLGFATADGGMGIGDDRFYRRLAGPTRRWDRLDLARLDGELTAASAGPVALRLGAVGYLRHDAQGDDGGLAGLADLGLVDLLAARGLDLGARLEVGFIGSAGLVRARADLGYRMGAFEPRVGYDYLRAGGAALQGPFAGLILHF